MCCPQQAAFEIYRDVELSVYLHDEKSDSGKRENEEETWILLKTKIEQLVDGSHENIQESSLELIDIINNGVYSQAVISKLLKNGISKESILKAMKFGLGNLSPADMRYFHIFGVSSDVLNEDFNRVDKELTKKLVHLGKSHEECMKIIIQGLINQSDCQLFQLSLNGFAVFKILNWQGPLICASNQVLNFLHVLGFNQAILSKIINKGINEEILGLLKTLGYCESMQGSSTTQEVLCDLNIRTKTPESCSCSFRDLEDTQTEIECCKDSSMPCGSQEFEKLDKKDFLRQNLMAPLTWALSRTLKYNPSNPTYYLACQLVRWRHYLDPLQKNEVLNFVNKSTSRRLDANSVVRHTN
ncbi:hypothetical protein QAD02_023430 [Eretmocerus hayati]|uniref:Uncharacterized protein n=1 Tax=Eretmocerus hayati TaxID=131215 RepID=A0ACC2PVS4_9HYME|nr:hypothetical protein QAD02_023430 [Eretmocerus hayati]